MDLPARFAQLAVAEPQWQAGVWERERSNANRRLAVLASQGIQIDMPAPPPPVPVISMEMPAAAIEMAVPAPAPAPAGPTGDQQQFTFLVTRSSADLTPAIGPSTHACPDLGLIGCWQTQFQTQLLEKSTR